MKRKFLFSVALAGVFFCGCSSEQKSVEYYQNNPEARQAKIKECKDKQAEFSLKNLNLKVKELEEAFKKSLGKTLAQECENARNAR